MPCMGVQPNYEDASKSADGMNVKPMNTHRIANHEQVDEADPGIRSSGIGGIAAE